MIRDTFHAIWKMIDLGFRTTAVALAEQLIPQAAWHQQFAIAQELAGQLVYHFYLYGELENAEKYDTMYMKYSSTVSYEYQAKKLYSHAIYNHKHNLPIDVEELMQMLESIKDKLQDSSLWYQYYYFQCKTLMYEGKELETLLIEAIEYFESAYYRHTSFINIFTKYLIEYYLNNGKQISARHLLEQKLPSCEIGSISWFRFLMTYVIILIEDGDMLKADEITKTAFSNKKYQELPQDRHEEWNAIVSRINELKISNKQKW